MENKKALCKSCSTPIADIKNDKINIGIGQSVSSIETDLKNQIILVKCRSCNNWNSFDIDYNQTIDYKKKANDILFYKN